MWKNGGASGSDRKKELRRMRGYQSQMPCDWWHLCRSTTHVVAAAEASWSGSCSPEIADPSPETEARQGREHPTGQPIGQAGRRHMSAAGLEERPAEASGPVDPATCRSRRSTGCRSWCRLVEPSQGRRSRRQMRCRRRRQRRNPRRRLC